MLLAGATGLVGSEILKLLLADDDVEELKVIVRRQLDFRVASPKIRALVLDFNALDSVPSWFQVDQVFSALGTTIRTAGSKEGFRRVDFDHPQTIARMARDAGARHFLLVSSAGADARSHLFYSRVKGEIEDAVRAMGYPSLTIARPSFLVGPRKEPRLGETIMTRLGFLLPRAWKPVEARQVAAGLVKAAREDLPGTRILDNVALRG